MTHNDIKRILQSSHTVAVVGISADQEKESYWIAAYLKAQGYKIIPVNPKGGEILGQMAYTDLLAIPDKVDVVQLFRPSADVPPFIPPAIQRGAKVVWMQTGIANKAAEKVALAAGLLVVMDTCIRVAHQFLIGAKG